MAELRAARLPAGTGQGPYSATKTEPVLTYPEPERGANPPAAVAVTGTATGGDQCEGPVRLPSPAHGTLRPPE